MIKVRLAALGLAVLSVGVLATPASAEKTVTAFRGKGAVAYASDCPANSPVGTKCTAWAVYAQKNRLNSDGTVSVTGGLGLDKFRVKITAGGFTLTPVAGGFNDTVAVQIDDDLSEASASGTVAVVKCNQKGKDCSTTRTRVALSLDANAPVQYFQDKTRTKWDDCLTVDRFSFWSRTAAGTVTINGVTYPTATPSPATPTAPEVPASNITNSKDVFVTRGECPQVP